MDPNGRVFASMLVLSHQPAAVHLAYNSSTARIPGFQFPS